MGVLDETISAGQPGHLADHGQASTKLNNLCVDVQADFGAACDDSADDTSAVQDAIDELTSTGGTVFVPGISRVNSAALTLPAHGIRFKGIARGKSALKSTTGTHDLFSVTGTRRQIAFEDISLSTHSSGGHVFNADTASASFWTWQRCEMTVGNAGKSIWSMTDGNFLDNYCVDSRLIAHGTPTVPVWQVISSSGGANSNTWTRMRCDNSGDYVFYIESTAVGSYANDNVWRDITFEITTGGNIKILSGNNCLIEECNTYDLDGATTNDLFYIGESATGSLASSHCAVRNSNRRGGSLGASKYDINLVNSSNSTRTYIENCQGTHNTGSATFVAFNCDAASFSHSATNGLHVTKDKLDWGGSVIDTVGSGTPEGVVTAGIGSTYRRTNGGAGTSFYVKESGTGNTGWVAK